MRAIPTTVQKDYRAIGMFMMPAAIYHLGNNYITGFTTDDANDLLSTLCTD